MSLLARLPAAALAAAVLAGAASCATKEVTLTTGGGVVEDASVLDDAAATAEGRPEARFPMPFCLTFVDANGANCVTCYDEWGDQTSHECKPPPTTCQVRDEPSGTRCLYCDENPGVASACLTCSVPAAANACSECTWSDNGAPCRRCLDAAGAPIDDSCDGVRAELR